MAMMEAIGAASNRVMERLAAGLAVEFGRPAGRALAERFLAAEEVDFHWDARRRERWISSYESLDDDGLELDRVAILGRLDGTWFVAVCIVDGEGQPHGLAGCRPFATLEEAEAGYASVH